MFKALSKVPPHIKIKITKSILFALVVVGIILFLTPLLYGKTGYLIVKLTSSSGDAQSLYITLEEIQVHPNFTGSNWETILDKPVTYDLITLNTNQTTIMTKKMIVGNYTKIRMWISNANITKDNRTHTITVPSSRLVVDLPFEIKPNQNTTLLITIPADKITVQAEDEFLLVPSAITISTQ